MESEEMNSGEQKYLQFLAYCLNGHIVDVPDVSGMDWYGLYLFAQQQAIVGIVLAGIDRLSRVQKLDVPQDILFEFVGQAQKIENQNMLLNLRVKELTEYLNQQGQKSCILKGQGNAMMYPNPLHRTSGDIDVWLKGTKKEIVNFVHQRFPDMNVQYHHMNYPVFDDVEVEVHYYPSYCYNKWHNYRLQQFFRECGEEQFSNINTEGYAVPTVVFNLVFQLSHMMRHFFTQGIGLRHAIDYYYLLQQDISNEERQEAVNVMKRCGMYKFFCAVLWVEFEVFGLKRDDDIAPINQRVGKLVLHEMLRGGNFGHQYEHNHNDSVIDVICRQILYNLRYVIEFPLEPFSRPFSLSWDYARKHIFFKFVPKINC